MHLHTDFSDGENSIEEMAAAAMRCGCREVCFTDHVRADSVWWPEYYAECRKAARSYHPTLKIFCGVEAKVCDFHGRLDVPRDLDAQILRVAALHRLPDGHGGFLRGDELKAYGAYAADCWFRAVDGLRENPSVNRLAHPFSLLPHMDVSFSQEFWERITSIMESASYLIEYNLKYDNSFVPPAFWRQFSKRLVIGTDSHSVSALQAAWTKASEQLIDIPGQSG